MWDLVPQPGVEPTSPALEGGVVTTGLPGKSPRYILLKGLMIVELHLNKASFIFNKRTVQDELR